MCNMGDLSDRDPYVSHVWNTDVLARGQNSHKERFSKKENFFEGELFLVLGDILLKGLHAEKLYGTLRLVKIRNISGCRNNVVRLFVCFTICPGFFCCPEKSQTAQ